MIHSTSSISVSHRKGTSPCNSQGKAAVILKGFIDNEAETTGINMFVQTSRLKTPTEKKSNPSHTLTYETPSGIKRFQVPSTTYMELTKAKPDKSMTGELQRHTGGKHFKQFDSTEEAYKFGQELADAHQQATNRSCIWVDKSIFLDDDMLGFILAIYSDQGSWDSVKEISPALIASVRDDPSLAPALIGSLIVADELNDTIRMSHVTPLQEVEDSVLFSPKQPEPDTSPTSSASTRVITKTTPFTPPAKEVPQLATAKL
jgi:hypothetical protein